MKQVSFSLFDGQAATFKNMVDSSIQSKTLRNFILNEYKLPSNLEDLFKDESDRTELKIEKFYFDDNTNLHLDELVKRVKMKGFKVNRSSLMRNIMKQMIESLKANEQSSPTKRELKHSSFYFEKGTKDILEQLISFRDRNAVIERFILEEYKPSNSYSLLLEKPVDVEPMRISIDKEAFNRLDQLIDELGIKKITRTSLMRDVVMQLITKLSHTDARKIIVKKKLDAAIDEFEKVFGPELLKEKLESYKINFKRGTDDMNNLENVYKNEDTKGVEGIYKANEGSSSLIDTPIEYIVDNNTETK